MTTNYIGTSNIVCFN